MKNFKAGIAVLVIILLSLFTFAALPGGSIKGTISPPDGATQVWAISATDTLKTTISSGAFEIPDVKSGTYKVMIDAADPYKDVTKDGIQVTDGRTTDLGEIKLEK